MRNLDGTHVYIVKFSDGVIKVGRTANLHERFKSHRSVAKKRGATVSAAWSHDQGGSAVEAESRLKEYGQRMHPRAWGLEHFTGDFDDFVTGARAHLIRNGLHEPMTSESTRGVFYESDVDAWVRSLPTEKPAS